MLLPKLLFPSLESAGAPTESQVQKQRSLTSRYSATPMITSVLLISARWYGVADL